MRREVCAHPGLDGAVVTQDKDSTVKVILLGVDGDMWVSVREELVGGCRAGSPCPEVSEVLLKVRVSVVERVKVDDVEVVFTSYEERESPM